MNWNRERTMIICAAMLLAAVPTLPQNPELQQKLAAVRQSAAENKQKLLQYQGRDDAAHVERRRQASDEKRLPVRPGWKGPEDCDRSAAGTPSGGRMKQRVIAKKKAEMKDYMQDVKAVLSMYVPPDPQKMQAAYQAGKVSLNPVPGTVNLVFTDYAQPGDKMTLTFDTATKKITGLNINTYMGDEKDAVTLKVQMGSLPDGTNYEQQTVLDATAKKLVVTTTNSNYQKLGG